MTPDAVELLRGLVGVPSLSGEEAEAVRYLVDVMSRMGYSAFVDDAGNAVGIRGGGERDLVLLGHIDTVPGDIPVRVEGDILRGRGSVDAKGPLAAFASAGARVDVPPGWRLIVIGAVEEESATSRGARFAAEQFAPAACVIGEPSGWDGITLGYKGRLLVRVRLEQTMSHTAGADRAIAEQGVDWWRRAEGWAERFNEGRERLFDRLLPSLRAINSATDGLTESVELRTGFRLPPGFDAREFEERVKAFDPAAELMFSGYEPAFAASPDTALVRAFRRGIRAQGARPVYKHKTGTSDMNVVGPRWNCPILAYGPGDSSLDHTPEEHISLEEYRRGIDVLSAALEHFMSDNDRLI